MRSRRTMLRRSSAAQQPAHRRQKPSHSRKRGLNKPVRLLPRRGPGRRRNQALARLDRPLRVDQLDPARPWQNSARELPKGSISTYGRKSRLARHLKPRADRRPGCFKPPRESGPVAAYRISSNIRHSRKTTEISRPDRISKVICERSSSGTLRRRDKPLGADPKPPPPRPSVFAEGQRGL